MIVPLLRGRERKRESISTSTGKRLEPLAERAEVLLREHGRRHEHGDLLAVHAPP